MSSRSLPAVPGLQRNLHVPRNREFRPDPRIQCIRRLPYILPVLRSGGFGDSAEAAGDDVVRPYDVIFDLIGGGMGGVEGRDGLDAVDSHGGNCALLSAEVMESLTPVCVLNTELAAGSGGAGGFRGSLGILRDYEILSDNGIPTGYSTAGKPGTTPRYGESAAATAALRC